MKFKVIRPETDRRAVQVVPRLRHVIVGLAPTTRDPTEDGEDGCMGLR